MDSKAKYDVNHRMRASVLSIVCWAQNFFLYFSGILFNLLGVFAVMATSRLSWAAVFQGHSKVLLLPLILGFRVHRAYSAAPRRHGAMSSWAVVHRTACPAADKQDAGFAGAMHHLRLHKQPGLS